MRILFANNICGYYGGVEQVIVHAARGLARRGHECFLAYAASGRDAALYTEAFVETLQCREFGALFGEPAGETFARILAAVRPDVVFVHNIAQLPAGAEHDRSVRTVRMVHDPELSCPTGLGYLRHGHRTCSYKAGWRCYLDLAFLARAQGARIPVKLVSIRKKLREMRRYYHVDRILAVSSFVRDRLIVNGFPSEKTKLCHPILDVEVQDPSPVPDDPHILFVGSLLRGKGVDLLLHALRNLSCEYHATIVGTGKSEAGLKRLCARLDLSDRVHFQGWVDHDGIGAYYQKAKVVAIPSRCPESFTIVGQESMRHGRPVVAFRVGGNADWLEDGKTGLLVPEQDVTAYASALQRLLTDTPYAAQLGAYAAKRVRERFTFEGFLNELEVHLSAVGAIPRQ